jgi:hypothetical protein
LGAPTGRESTPPWTIANGVREIAERGERGNASGLLTTPPAITTPPS